MTMLQESPGTPRRPVQNVLDVVRGAMPSLRRSDAKVASLVLQDPSWVLESTVASVAYGPKSLPLPPKGFDQLWAMLDGESAPTNEISNKM